MTDSACGRPAELRHQIFDPFFTTKKRGQGTGLGLTITARIVESHAGVLELEIEDLIAGLRPATPDNLPAIGAGTLDGLIWATGHFRNGILLAPLAAEAVADLLSPVGATR